MAIHVLSYLELTLGDLLLVVNSLGSFIDKFVTFNTDINDLGTRNTESNDLFESS